MKLVFLFILIVLMTLPACAQIQAPPPTPAELEFRARIEAERRAPIIAMHGHWHDDYFEMGLYTPVKNKVLDKFAHYKDKLKPLVPIETLLDKICSPAERSRIFHDEEQMSKLPKHFFTLTVPAEQQAKYLRDDYLTHMSIDIKDRYHKLDRINNAISTRERVLEQRVKIYQNTVADCEKYLTEHPEIRTAIRQETREAELKTWEGMEKASAEGWQELWQKDLSHKQRIRALIDRKYELIDEKERLAEKEKQFKSSLGAYDKAVEEKSDDARLWKDAVHIKEIIIRWQTEDMQKSAQKWATKKEEIIKAEPALTAEVMAQE